MIFKKIEDTDVVTGRTNRVSSGFFTGEQIQVLQSALTTSSFSYTPDVNAPAQNAYYVNFLYNSEVHFSVAYGDYADSGSYSTSKCAKANYTTYKNALLSPSDTKFSFASGSATETVDSETIFALNFSPDKFKDRIDEGQFEICIAGNAGSPNQFTKLTLIDDSKLLNKQSSVYNLISGSIINGVPTPYNSGEYGGFGLFYPKNGVVILNASKVDDKVNFASGVFSATPRTNTPASFTLFTNALLGTVNFPTIVAPYMKVRKSEYFSATNYFIRVKNREFNYTNNPTFVSDGTDGQVVGTIKYQDLIDNPKTYPTTVGLYNDNNELVAVAKLSRPTQKTFDNELLIKVMLQF